MVKKDIYKNPALDVKIQDLFEKDPDLFTDDDWSKTVEYYRALRAEWSKAEAAKAAKKAAKKNKTPATQEEMEEITL